jgi:hypothetical protein
MVLNRNIKAASGAILFLIITICFSCEKPGYLVVDCTECYTEEPKNATLEIKLEVFSNVQTVLRIYEGNLEDSLLYREYKLNGTSTTATVPVNNDYTLTAKYYIAGRYYIAVNSVTPRIKYEKETCNDPCYYVYNKKVDLRLKYYAY